MINRDVCSGQKMVLLVRAEIHRIIQEIPADPTIVEQSISFCRCSIRHQRLTRTFNRAAELQKGTFRLAYCFSEAGIGVKIAHTGLKLLLFELRHADRVSHITFCMTNKQAKRTSMCRKFFHIEHRETLLAKDVFHRKKREVGKMLVVDSIELIAFDETK